jgi:hypothetical protein
VKVVKWTKKKAIIRTPLVVFKTGKAVSVVLDDPFVIIRAVGDIELAIFCNNIKCARAIRAIGNYVFAARFQACVGIGNPDALV